VNAEVVEELEQQMRTDQGVRCKVEEAARAPRSKLKAEVACRLKNDEAEIRLRTEQDLRQKAEEEVEAVHRRYNEEGSHMNDEASGMSYARRRRTLRDNEAAFRVREERADYRNTRQEVARQTE
jgi:hypothetical protein